MEVEKEKENVEEELEKEKEELMEVDEEKKVEEELEKEKEELMEVDEEKEEEDSIAQTVKARFCRKVNVIWTPPTVSRKKKKLNAISNKGSPLKVDDYEIKTNPAASSFQFFGIESVGEDTISALEGYFRKFSERSQTVIRVGDSFLTRAHMDEIILDQDFGTDHIDSFVALLFHRLQNNEKDYIRSIYIPPLTMYLLQNVPSDTVVENLNHITKDTLSNAGLLFIPIAEKSHWVLGVGILKEKKWALYDSIPNEYHLSYLVSAVATLHKYKGKHFDSDIRDWPFVLMKKIQVQTGSHNCGAFVCRYIEALVTRETIHCTDQRKKGAKGETWQSDMARYRIQMALDIYSNCDVKYDMPTLL